MLSDGPLCDHSGRSPKSPRSDFSSRLFDRFRQGADTRVHWSRKVGVQPQLSPYKTLDQFSEPNMGGVAAVAAVPNHVEGEFWGFKR